MIAKVPLLVLVALLAVNLSVASSSEDSRYVLLMKRSLSGSNKLIENKSVRGKVILKVKLL